jgi:hypothetical protein
MPPDLLKSLPGYDTNVSQNRGQARQIMEKLGYGTTNRLMGVWLATCALGE